MKITFPHFGNVYIAVKVLLDGLGVDYVIPPISSNRALELGIEYSPEEMCLPFKIMMGNYIQSIQQGADTVIIIGSCGPCRFGEYGELQMNLLKKLGYEVEFIVIDVPRDIGIQELMKRIGRIGADSKKSKAEKILISIEALRVMKLIDEIEERVRYLSGYEKNRGECKTLLMNCKQEVIKSKNPREAIGVLLKYRKKVMNLEIDENKKPLRIAIIGEIYTIIEPFSNLYLENKLMEYGVSTKKTLTPSWWVKDMALSTINMNSINIRRAAKEYLQLCVGGHAVECVGEAVIAHNEGYDGAIQIFPLGCMPEIVSKAILPTISSQKNLPILTLVVDEMTGETGYITRLEAFLDLLERRR